MIRIKIHVIKIYVKCENVSRRPCLLDSLILRRFYLLRNWKYTCTPMMFQDFLLRIFAYEFEQVWSRKILEQQRNYTKKKICWERNIDAKVVPSCVKNSLFVWLFVFFVFVIKEESLREIGFRQVKWQFVCLCKFVLLIY